MPQVIECRKCGKKNIFYNEVHNGIGIFCRGFKCAYCREDNCPYPECIGHETPNYPGRRPNGEVSCISVLRNS